MSIELINTDCMLYMAGLPDKAFDLAIVDPPYGIGVDGNKEQRWPDGSIKRKAHEVKGWDFAIPDADYFAEIKRVSTDQIIWGGNYFTKHLPPSKAWVFWYKGQNDLTMSDGEMAWTSYQKVTRQINLHRTHLWQEQPIHPTQKPVKLYEWLLTNYAKPGQRILDTHLGSGSSAIAAHNLGFDFVGMELDADYYASACKRFEQNKAQGSLFVPDTPRDAYEQTDFIASVLGGA
jgi:site-specific DNA-methyltransferase (adenine-specific)